MKTTKDITVEIYTPKTLADLETLKALILEKSGPSMWAEVEPCLGGYALYFGYNPPYDTARIYLSEKYDACELWHIPGVGFEVIKKSS